MITLLLAFALAAEPSGSFTAGLAVGPLAWDQSASHALRPALSAWATWAPRPWGLTVDAAWSRDRAGSDVATFRGDLGRLSILGGAALGTHAATAHLDVGPAFVLRSQRLDGVGGATRLDPGLRARVAVTGKIAGPVGFAWWMAGTARPGGVDWEAAVGLGMYRPVSR